MVSPVRVAPFLLAALLVPGASGALLPSADVVADDGPLGLPTEAVVEAVMTNASGVLGENLSREDVRVSLDLDFRTLDFDLVGMVFGGGTLESNPRLAARLELRAISVGRIEEALRERTDGAVNLSQLGINASQQVLTADEFRAALAGEALAAFEAEQEALVKDLVESSFPDLTVLSARFDWRDTDPAASLRGDAERQFPRLTEPPIVLDAVVDLQVLRRESLADLVADALRRKQQEDASGGAGGADDAEEQDPRKALVERLRAENEGAFYERSAFSRLGLTQLLVLRMEPGWDLDLAMRLPKGYTFEYASADVDVGRDLAGAQTTTYAGKAADAVANPVAVSISNRYLVTVALLVGTLVAGALVRFPVVLAANLLLVRRARRGGREARRIPVAGASDPAAAPAPEAAPGQRGT